MSESLPFERATARLAAPEWYDFHYFRRLKRVITPMSLMAALLIGFGVFVIVSCVYVSVVAAVVGEAGSGMVAFVGFLEVGLVSLAVWAFAHDYEQRRKERRLTPYGRRLHAWLEEEFVPWLQDELSIFIEVEDAEELIIRKAYIHVSYRGSSHVKLAYEDGDILIARDVLRSPGSSIFYESALDDNDQQD